MVGNFSQPDACWWPVLSTRIGLKNDIISRIRLRELVFFKKTCYLCRKILNNIIR